MRHASKYYTTEATAEIIRNWKWKVERAIENGEYGVAADEGDAMGAFIKTLKGRHYYTAMAVLQNRQ